MSVFITFAAALLIFGAVIAIHEFGHFAVAKLCGVQVNEFSIGMGPTLIKTYRKGTQYTLRLLPVGGFVALEGEESPESEQAEGGSGDDDVFQAVCTLCGVRAVFLFCPVQENAALDRIVVRRFFWVPILRRFYK